jgi:Trk K+ transport system NAD-binding subunit
MFFFAGYSDDARALIDHLRAEAPGLLGRVVVVDGDPRLDETLAPLGVTVVYGDPLDLVALLDAGVQDARMVVVFPADPAAETDRTLRVVRALSRLGARQIFVKAATREDAARLYAVGATEVMLAGAAGDTPQEGRLRPSGGWVVDTT